MALPVWAYYMQAVQNDPQTLYPAAAFKQPDGSTNGLTPDSLHVLDEGLLPDVQEVVEDQDEYDGFSK